MSPFGMTSFALHREDARAAQHDRALRLVLRHGDRDVVTRGFVDRTWPVRRRDHRRAAAAAAARPPSRRALSARVTESRTAASAAATIVGEERVAERVVDLLAVVRPGRELAADAGDLAHRHLGLRRIRRVDRRRVAGHRNFLE